MYGDHAVIAAQKGNSTAFIKLIKHYEITLYRISKTILKSDIYCADVIHETILKAYQHINTLKDPQYFKAWLIRILISECISILKLEKGSKAIDTVPCRSISQNKYKRTDILKVIESLEYELRIPAVLYFLEDMNSKEISNLLSMQQSTVISRLYSAKIKLSESLGISIERDENYERVHF